MDDALLASKAVCETEGAVEPVAGKFDYQEAISRNLGWVSSREQEVLRGKKIAIAGMGGVGGAHLLTLARLGIGGFKIADMDLFEIANFNRQVGATLSTVGQAKVEVMAKAARDINPEICLDLFPSGVDQGNLDAFLSDVDLFVDGLDFFVTDVRRAVFERCFALGIPAITAAPVGFGTAYIVFMPGKMSFEELFRMEGVSKTRQFVNFATGLTPRGFHRRYLVDPSRLDLVGQRGPSTAAAVSLCAGVVGTEAVKILTGRGTVKCAPWVHQFDPYGSSWHKSYLRFGNRGPLQTLKRTIGYRAFEHLSRHARPAENPCVGDELDHILHLARWAPSGDNLQPWRFEKSGEDRVVVHIQTEGEDRNIYDFNGGQPTLLSAGFLMETLRLAASRYGREMSWRYSGEESGDHRLAVDLPKRADITEDPLTPYIPIRSVNRRPFQKTALSGEQKTSLENALGDQFEIKWFEDRAGRWAAANLNARATDIRLRLKEAYDVHARILDWDRVYCEQGVPSAAVGLDPATVKLMRWVMGDWRRVKFMNRYLAGTVMPRIQLDLVPGLGCAAHFFVLRKDAKGEADGSIPGLIKAGAALQRFWLEATRMGLALQPGLAPLCFAAYGRDQRAERFDPAIRTRLKSLNGALEDLLRDRPEQALFAGRVGLAPEKVPGSRSLRHRLSHLLVGGSDKL